MNLLSVDQIIANAVSDDPRKVGIYFLISRNQIVYVGKSIDVMSRIAIHRASGKEFDSWTYMPCDNADLDSVERFYIDTLLPPLNDDPITRRKIGKPPPRGAYRVPGEPNPHPPRRPIYTPAQIFPSRRAAARAHNITRQAVDYRAKNGWCGWRFADEPEREPQLLAEIRDAA